MIEDGITAIGSYAFAYCSAAEIAIPSTVARVGNEAFLGAETLAKVDYNAEEDTWVRVLIGEGNEPLENAVVFGLPKLSTIDGAQIRTSGVQGLRFISRINKCNGSVNVKEYGTLLIPSDDVTDINDVQVGAVLNGHKVAKVPVKYLYRDTDEELMFTAVLINVPVSQYKRSITARAYAIMEDGSVVYGDSAPSRSIYQVAKLGLENPDETEANKQTFHEILTAVDDNTTVYPW